MSNPARDLLNFVDEHKTEMKDNTYKCIVDKIAPINKMIEENTKSKYKIFILVTDFCQDEDDPTLHEATYANKCVDIFLSDKEAEHINKELDQYGNINRIWSHECKESQGLQMAETIRSIFVNAFENTKATVRDGDDDLTDGEIICSNRAVITRIKKC